MDIYNEKYFNRRNWILENAGSLSVSATAILVLLEIDFIKEFNQQVTLDLICQYTGLKKVDVDKAINELMSKDLLSVETKETEIDFDISNIFSKRIVANNSEDIFALFETEFSRVLTQRELTIISEWCRIYTKEDVISALREASINRKLSCNYIDKILANNYEKK